MGGKLGPSTSAVGAISSSLRSLAAVCEDDKRVMTAIVVVIGVQRSFQFCIEGSVRSQRRMMSCNFLRRRFRNVALDETASGSPSFAKREARA